MRSSVEGLAKKISAAVIVAVIGSIHGAQAKVTDPGLVIAGPADAKVTIEEFSDFECPYCARGAETIAQALKEYPREINLVYRDLPLPFHEQALPAARAFTAVRLQKPAMAYEFAKEIFAHQDELRTQGSAFLFQAAERVGADVERMKADMNGAAVTQSLAEDAKLAEANAFKGTPSFRIGAKQVIGARSYKEIKEAIESQLRR